MFQLTAITVGFERTALLKIGDSKRWAQNPNVEISFARQQ